MTVITFGQGRKALQFGEQKINLHELGSEFEPKANSPKPGSADLCFITNIQMPDVIHHLNVSGVTIEEGPIDRTGALGRSPLFM
ncbi:MAG TPA: hypothetical protein VNM45_21130 [Bacillus sp. (in: firmicutes)]|nr:hypothetical protein [Bacillus sp. (in: firmicutes)]